MNALVAYFSASGTTAKAAKVLAKAADADLYEIKPAIPYTRADLNWMDKGSRSSVEMSDKHSRPALADTDAPIAGHDVIFLYRQDHYPFCHLRRQRAGQIGC